MSWSLRAIGTKEKVLESIEKQRAENEKYKGSKIVDEVAKHITAFINFYGMPVSNIPGKTPGFSIDASGHTEHWHGNSSIKIDLILLDL